MHSLSSRRYVVNLVCFFGVLLLVLVVYVVVVIVSVLVTRNMFVSLVFGL